MSEDDDFENNLEEDDIQETNNIIDNITLNFLVNKSLLHKLNINTYTNKRTIDKKYNDKLQELFMSFLDDTYDENNTALQQLHNVFISFVNKGVEYINNNTKDDIIISDVIVTKEQENTSVDVEVADEDYTDDFENEDNDDCKEDCETIKPNIVKQNTLIKSSYIKPKLTKYNQIPSIGIGIEDFLSNKNVNTKEDYIKKIN